jgi:broad specificity phosphatase PhoE
MTRTVVHLVRHGEVQNPQGILYVLLPGFTLSERGGRMATALVDHFRGCDVALIRSSPLTRTQETASPLGQALGMDVETDERLIEAPSNFQGMRLGKGYDSLWNPVHWRHLYNPWRPSWGEPYREQAKRMAAAVEDARVSAIGREAVCFSHQLPIWIARQWMEGKRLWHFAAERQNSLGSVTSFHFDDRRLCDVTYCEPVLKVL